MKNFVKSLNKGSPFSQFIQAKFSYVRDAKLRVGVFDGPQIRELMKYSTFDEVLTCNEKYHGYLFKMSSQTSTVNVKVKTARIGFKS